MTRRTRGDKRTLEKEMENKEFKKWQTAYDEAYPQTPYEEKADTNKNRKKSKLRIKLMQLENACFLLDYYYNKINNAKTEAEEEQYKAIRANISEFIDKTEAEIIEKVED